MKKFLFSLIAVGLATASFAQTPVSYKKRPSLGVGVFLNDMYTADKISRTSLSRVMQSGGFTPLKEMSMGLNVQYFEGITEHVDFMAGLYGSYTKYPFYFRSGVPQSVRSLFLLEADANVNVKMLSDKYTLVPYMTFGVGASMYNGTYFAAQGNTGLGLQLNLGNETFLNTQLLYRPGISSLAVNHMAYTVGVSSPIGGEKPAPAKVTPPPPPAPAPAPVDTDKDGINDKDDKCPTVAGVAKYNGCPVPDTDKDGINDENDKCPTVAGIAKYNGCPIPDTDKDGVNDEEDKCPSVPGLARYQGCPIPDTDGDGVNDEEDKCPTIKGARENNGCPELKATYNFDNKKVQFLSGSAVLTKVSKVELNKVVKALNENPTLKLMVEGHTDATGSDKINQPLSLKRANAVKAYLVAQKIDAARLTAEGFGSSQPIADNKTAKGKAMNRRVDFKVQE
ncbi:OmpA family protein [Sediminibacterium sp.]|uniref:OmpA family protein n=1 Tax=Sediminibacterium sp. TaxID=1917865 RepID=UPI003F69ABD9